MHEVKLDPKHTGNAGVVFPRWDPTKHDWTGARRTRHLQVVARVSDSPDGERQWALYCSKCRGTFYGTDHQLDRYATRFCGCDR